MKRYICASLIVGLFALTVVSEEPAKKVSTPAVATASATKPAPASAAVSPKKAGARESYVVIGYLEKRDRVITIKSGPRGPVYTVADRNGKVLFENVSAEQLKAQAPEIHNLIKTGVADARTRPISAAVRSDARF